MFNLLPKNEKEAIRREYRIRLAIVTLWLSFATLVVASVLLLPSFLLSSQKEKAAQLRVEALSKSVQQGSAAELDKLLLDAKARLALLSHKAPNVFLHELILQVAALKTDRVSLSDFSIAKTGEGQRGIDITGVAKDRAALLSFVKALERSGLFEKVDVPISNFAKDVEIDFSLRTHGNF